MNQSIEKGFFHTMNQDEDIWLLAELYYGDAQLWWIIYHANLEVLGDNPEYAEPGLEVFIPYLEVSEEDEQVPEFFTHKAGDPSYDPLVLLVQDRYDDHSLCFDLYEHNGWELDHVIQPGDAIVYLARARKPALKRAKRWRSIFYRG